MNKNSDTRSISYEIVSIRDVKSHLKKKIVHDTIISKYSAEKRMRFFLHAFISLHLTDGI